MGTTGSSEKIAMNQALPDIITRVRQYATVPIAVGFGVASRNHSKTVADAGADGVVVGSRVVSVIKNSLRGEIAKNVESCCLELCRPALVRSSVAASGFSSSSTHPKNSEPGTTSDPETVLPARFGQFGGQYVPETIFDCLIELEAAHKAAMADPDFWKELQSYYGYMNRPSRLYLAENLTNDAGGARIWLKREDL
jgi:tryptophan synthase